MHRRTSLENTQIIRKFVKNPKFEQEIRKQIGSSIDTTELDKEYDKFTDLEKKTSLKSFLSDVFIYEEEQKDGRILKGLRFKFPIYMNGRNVLGVDWDNESTDETVVMLQHNSK